MLYPADKTYKFYHDDVHDFSIRENLEGQSLSQGPAAVINKLPPQRTWGKGFTSDALPHCCFSSKEMRAGTQTGKGPGGRGWCRGHGEERLTGLLSQLSYGHQPRSGTAHSELCPPTSTANQENAPQACLQANQVEAFSTEVSFSKITLAHIKLT